MTECPPPERIAAAISGELPVDVRGDLLDHAAVCRVCHAVLLVLDGETQMAVGSAPPLPGAVTTQVGDVIGRYELVALLGSGGMGVVYRARDRELDRDVALKLLRPGRPAERLRREAQLLAKLDAPNIVTVYDVGTHAGAAYVVMELVDGESLRGYLASSRAPADVLAICLRAGEGLAAAHRAGVVHRDFKPDNVFVARDGSVHVGDFGLAGASPGEATAIAATDLTITGTVLGTPAYMAPEQIEGEATAASDQYAFCVTVWEALTGKRPIDAPTVDQLFDAIRAGTIGAPARPLPGRIERALRRGLARDPAARFTDMPALLAALAPPRRRWRWLAAAGGAAVAATTVIALAVRVDEPGCALAPRATPPVLEALARGFGPAVRAEAEAALAEWETARVAACRLDDRPRLACLRLVATRGDAILTQLARDPSLEPDLAELGVDRGVARCLALPPALTPALAVFDVEAARIDTFLQRTPFGARDLPALDRFAAAVGAPAVARAQWLAARSAADRSDNAAAFAVLPALIASADQLRDDELRARASALHAEVLGRTNRVVEARAALDQARAGWARIGRPDELALGNAEIAILVAENKIAQAAQRAESLVPLVRARYALHGPRLTAALGRASSLWSAAGNYARSAELQAEQIARARQDAPALSPAELASLMTNTTALLNEGELHTVVTTVTRNLEILRTALARYPESGRDLTAAIGYQLSQLAQGHELLAESPDALVWFRNLRAHADDTRLDPAVATRFRAEALEGEARHLNRLGRHADAIEPARAVIALARASTDPDIQSALLPATLQLVRALHATGAAREARDLVEAAYATLADTTPPYTRGIATAYFAYALWDTGDARDRGRARVLAEDAARDFEKARATIRAIPSLRPIEPVLDKDVAALTRWRGSH